MVHQRSMGSIGALLDVTTGGPAEHRGRTSMFGENLRILDTTVPDSVVGDLSDRGFVRGRIFRPKY